ncbi:hypothetical protein [Paraherbaspirillum soli]|uniref:Uncharacterized protein n=1 Tax=Paraherbaspirillum soli TaxID=631222 RepID=A0ABW0MDT5_9BURK
MLFIDRRDYKKGALSRAIAAQASAFYDRLFSAAILPDFRGENRQITGHGISAGSISRKAAKQKASILPYAYPNIAYKRGYIEHIL